MKPLVMAGRRIPLAALVAAAVMAAASCASPSGGESESESGSGSGSSCEYLVEYDTRTYTGLANADFTIGEELGSATVPPCDDSLDDEDGPDSPDSPTSTIAYAVEGVDPSIAIAVEDAPDGVLFVAETLDGDLPPEIERLIGGS
ncbi:DUF6281 family protein [Streptomyces sp. NPDC004610]|uniref:DUF6281 family protein n=1 Tax=unclassified Streptomyces TaxID=2593676 RepID=UPI0033B7970C